jgi:hypothetical protein
MSAAERLDREERLDPDACRALCHRVIEQALHDLATETDLRHVGSAAIFLADPGSALEFWISGTRFEVEHVQRRAREILLQRFGAGEGDLVWRVAAAGEEDVIERVIEEEPEGV